MDKQQPSGIDDLIPGLEQPLWAGVDREFAEYAREVFGIPDGIEGIRITPPGSAGRSAVAIQGQAGAIILALTPNVRTRKTLIVPIIAGPICKDAEIVRRAEQSDVNKNSHAISALMLRHLPVDVVKNLMLKDFH